MRILFRNFTKLLAIGKFESDYMVERMSEFKWNKLFLVAIAYGVDDYISTGIMKSGGEAIPRNIYETACNNSSQAKVGINTDKFSAHNFTSRQQAKKFSSFYLNRKYNRIIFNEVHSIDTSIDSLVLLDKLTDNINKFVNEGIDIKSLADLGTYLRTCGNKIDFVKIENWTNALRIRNISNIIACCLICLFRFEPDEFPFIKNMNGKYQRKINRLLEEELNAVPQLTKNQSVDEEKHRQGINPISKPSAKPLKYFKYFPLETSSRFMANILKSLSNIDE